MPLLAVIALLAQQFPTPAQPPMLWGDTSRLNRPFAKDPSVIRDGKRYLMYYSMPARNAGDGWGIGIAESADLKQWTKIAEVLPDPNSPHEAKGICAPFAKRIGKEIHLFYQTYGNGRGDAICRAVSRDGIHFTRDATNPVFHPTGNWNAGRAIDAEVVRYNGRWLLYAATRDPAMKVQMMVAAVSKDGKFGRDSWSLAAEAPVLKPELPWERDCIEAPATVVRKGWLYMFYGGAYNNAPQQIGCARSKDGIHWQRLGDQPFLAVGKAGSWNSSESGHPATFVDKDGQTYLFYQGNNDQGKTWKLSYVKIGWKRGQPFVIQP